MSEANHTTTRLLNSRSRVSFTSRLIDLQQIAAQLMLKADDTKSLWESAVSSRWTACPRNEVERVVQQEQCYQGNSNLH